MTSEDHAVRNSYSEDFVDQETKTNILKQVLQTPIGWGPRDCASCLGRSSRPWHLRQETPPPHRIAFHTGRWMRRSILASLMVGRGRNCHLRTRYLRAVKSMSGFSREKSQPYLPWSYRLSYLIKEAVVSSAKCL